MPTMILKDTMTGDIMEIRGDYAYIRGAGDSHCVEISDIRDGLADWFPDATDEIQENIDALVDAIEFGGDVHTPAGLLAIEVLDND